MSETPPTESTEPREILPRWVDQFLVLIAAGTVAEACRQCQLDRTTPYALRKTHPSFAARWDKIKQATIARIHDNLVERLADGWDEPFVVAGEVLNRKVYDNKTALAYLKSREPEKYSERRYQPPQQDTGEQHRVEIVFAPQPETAPDTSKET